MTPCGNSGNSSSASIGCGIAMSTRVRTASITRFSVENVLSSAGDFPIRTKSPEPDSRTSARNPRATHRKGPATLRDSSHAACPAVSQDTSMVPVDEIEHATDGWRSKVDGWRFVRRNLAQLARNSIGNIAPPGPSAAFVAAYQVEHWAAGMSHDDIERSKRDGVPPPRLEIQGCTVRDFRQVHENLDHYRDHLTEQQLARVVTRHHPAYHLDSCWTTWNCCPMMSNHLASMDSWLS